MPLLAAPRPRRPSSARLVALLTAVGAAGLTACASAGVPTWQRAEDRRDPDPAVFAPALGEAGAVRALGRLAAPELAPLASRVLDDLASEHRALAAWALGEYGVVEGFEPAAAPDVVAALERHARDADVAVRAAVALALGRVRSEGAVRALLADPAPTVREHAVLGLFWLAVLSQRPLEPASVTALLDRAGDPAPRVRRALAVAFSRKPDPRAESVLAMLASGSGDAALFATRGLGRLAAQSPGTVELLARLARTGEPAVRVEATLALKDPARVPAPDASEPDVTLRAVRAQKTGRAADGEASGWVRALAAETRAAETFEPALSTDPDPRVRAAAIGGLAHAGETWPAAFTRAFADPSREVVLAALAALGTVPGEAATERLRALLPTLPDDPTLRGAAAEAVAERKDLALADALAALAAASLDDRFVELRETVADALTALERWDLVAALAADPAPSVRSRAARALAAHEGKPAPALDRRRAEASPFLGADRARRLVLETDRGAIVIALDGALAPTTAAAITALARRGFYDGTPFHRLVPNFVLQGGDPTGTGWGDAGFQLRDEVSERPFDLGAVGLAKAGPDTGSCQLFVMLAPAPHLAGRYTRVGEVVSGMDVARALERGDVIRRAYTE